MGLQACLHARFFTSHDEPSATSFWIQMNVVVSPDSRPSSSKGYRAAGQDARRGGRGKRVKKSRTLGHPIVDVSSDEKEASVSRYERRRGR